MTMPASSLKERKVSQSASCKIDCIVRQLFLPMLSMPLPESTSFLEEEESVESLLMQQIAKENPSAVGSEKDFVEYMVQLYQRFQQGEACPQEKRSRRTTKPSASGSEGLD